MYVCVYFGPRYSPIQVQNWARINVKEYSFSEMSFATGQKAKKFDIPGW